MSLTKRVNVHCSYSGGARDIFFSSSVSWRILTVKFTHKSTLTHKLSTLSILYHLLFFAVITLLPKKEVDALYFPISYTEIALQIVIYVIVELIKY